METFPASRRLAAGATAAVLLSGWWLVAWRTTSRTAQRLAESAPLVAVDPPLQVSLAAALRVAVLAGLGILLVAAGRRRAAVVVPALATLPAAIWPTWADFTGPVHLGVQVEPIALWHLRLAACATLAVVAAPSLVLVAGGRGRRLPLAPGDLAGRLAVPATVAAVAAAFDWADPNGPGPIRWPLLAMYGLAAALLVLGALPRPVAWTGAVLVPVLHDLDVAGALAAGTDPGPALGRSLPTALVAVAVALWVVAAPRLARAWVRVVRRERPALLASPQH